VKTQRETTEQTAATNSKSESTLYIHPDNQTTLLALTSNLTQASAVLESKITNLTAEIQDLKTQRNNLTQQIQNMERNSNELNISRAQWSIDAYCPRESNGRVCNACQKGWNLFQSSCYAFNDAESPNQKTWEEARENCTGKISDLAVIDNDTEKVMKKIGYWIGLRAEEGTWKWVDGTLGYNNLLPTVSVTFNKMNVWKAVNCSEKYTWLCKKKALSV
uniref:C-type lectin domain-containing protein n=1 Tax=Monopterus albus TaxID=43700 RepID=A0A3Q3J5S3_MONAL